MKEDKMKKSGMEKFVISGKAFWINLSKPNELSKKYSLTLSVDSTTKKLLESKGVTVKHDDKNSGMENDRGDYVVLEKVHTTKDGRVLDPPMLIDGKKNPMPSNTAIGNGSMVNVETHVFETSFRGKNWVKLGLGTVQLKTLVVYEKERLSQFPEEDFVHDSSQDVKSEALFDAEIDGNMPDVDFDDIKL